MLTRDLLFLPHTSIWPILIKILMSADSQPWKQKPSRIHYHLGILTIRRPQGNCLCLQRRHAKRLTGNSKGYPAVFPRRSCSDSRSPAPHLGCTEVASGSYTDTMGPLVLLLQPGGSKTDPGNYLVPLNII